MAGNAILPMQFLAFFRVRVGTEGVIRREQNRKQQAGYEKISYCRFFIIAHDTKHR